MKFLKRLFRDEEGQGMVEYGLILALVSVVVIVVLTSIGSELNRLFKLIESQLEDATTG
jgi:pilus assembly protein Flp/PilA